jgi:ABC-type dipeptide/oligopeptide/nickel transport system permease subunit
VHRVAVVVGICGFPFCVDPSVAVISLSGPEFSFRGVFEPVGSIRTVPVGWIGTVPVGRAVFVKVIVAARVHVLLGVLVAVGGAGWVKVLVACGALVEVLVGLARTV